MIIEQSQHIIDEISKVFIGKDEIIKKVLMTIYAGGHILLNDTPGTGKTTLALAFSKALGLDYKRIQFTTDTLPSDIVGFTMLNNENDNAYFPFDIYKNEKWDIEHITSITDDIPKQKSSWLNDAKVFIDTSKEDGKELKTRADTCDCENDTEFEALFTDIVNHFNFHLKDGDINDISNLALLDSETNRGYKNAVFPLKRKIEILAHACH